MLTTPVACQVQRCSKLMLTGQYNDHSQDKSNGRCICETVERGKWCAPSLTSGIVLPNLSHSQTSGLWSRPLHTDAPRHAHANFMPQEKKYVRRQYFERKSVNDDCATLLKELFETTYILGRSKYRRRLAEQPHRDPGGDICIKAYLPCRWTSRSGCKILLTESRRMSKSIQAFLMFLNRSLVHQSLHVPVTGTRGGEPQAIHPRTERVEVAMGMTGERIPRAPTISDLRRRKLLLQSRVVATALMARAAHQAANVYQSEAMRGVHDTRPGRTTMNASQRRTRSKDRIERRSPSRSAAKAIVAETAIVQQVLCRASS